MYCNGDIAPTGPHFRRGGYKLWNWCVKCECVWEKKISWCKKCNSRLRFGGRYISRREKEAISNGEVTIHRQPKEQVVYQG